MQIVLIIFFPKHVNANTFDSFLVGSDGGALDSDVVFFDSLGTVDGDFVVGGVAMFHTQIERVELNVQEGQDQLLLDDVPDDTGHLVSQHFDNRSSYSQTYR